ncbi:arabinogalactan endo-1,4-beta-galactosidase [Flammeovirga sp. MY04]|uniref:glycoside hydrolase family 53 protein n=1 Tax=Flammeovirga sp. MY04 TaxID=1191459 RepID=UPI0008063B9D|nr:glycosyl hydrolase 53 family protein [Flammeovirga sp. MY04]ANQ51391.1 arabinogalactan endo-1,4-beta-galactosidase [Flammeovirga sp. MY04]
MNIKIQWFIPFLLLIYSCSNTKKNEPISPENNFINGVDLSYVNQIQERGGRYFEGDNEKDIYQIFSEKGNDLVRLRLWHHPIWTKELYGDEGTKMYNDFDDIQKSIIQSKKNNMKTLLDFHYSDTWADPEKQYVPKAWEQITDINVLRDSVYNYTFSTLDLLGESDALPDLIQLGNETNCGLFYSDRPENFPSCEVCNDKNWENAATIFQAGVEAVTAIEKKYEVDIKKILHVADPQYLDWWFGELSNYSVDYDIIGVSYYPLWHTAISFNNLPQHLKSIGTKFNKEVMILETAYPWTREGNDDMPNLFGDQTPLPNYPFTAEGQLNYMRDLTKEMKEVGVIGVVYWEAGWIAYPIKTLWGTGSSWENCTYFDYENKSTIVFDYLK